VIANLVAVLVLVVALVVLRDHRAIVASFMAEALVYVVASHVLASERYLIKTNSVVLRAALQFGIPLLINGIGLAVITQLDRVLVGHWFGVSKLANYAVILGLTVTPVGLILRVFGTAALSYLLSAKDRRNVIPVRNYHLLVFLFGLVAVSYMLLVATTMDVLTPVIFGREYKVDLHVQVLITAIVFLRIQCAGAPTNHLLATSRTRELAAINLARALGLFFAVCLMLLRSSFTVMLLGFLIGDLVTLALFFGVSSAQVFVRRSQGAVDLGASVVSAMIICGILDVTLGKMPEARAVVLGVGILVIATQILIGVRTDGPVRAFFRTA
jgi:O-antigen/teichoic acid export membrane protein